MRRSQARRTLAGVAAVGVAVATAFGLGDLAGAQEVQPVDIVSIDKRDAPGVSITVAPTGELADAELEARDFGVRENGKRRDVEATPVASGDVEVALVIDTSGSIRGAPLDAAKAAAVGFVEQMKPGTRAVVVGFGSTAYVAQPMTGDSAALTYAIQSLQANGETALYDAVGTALAQFSADAERSVIVLSDGGDTASTGGIDPVLATLSSAGAAFYGVTLETPESDLAAMNRLADAAGGRSVPAADPAALTGVYDSIAALFQNQFRLTFTAAGPGGPTEVEITVRSGNETVSIARVVELPTGGASTPVTTPARPARPTVVEDPGMGWALPLGLGALFAGILVGALMLFAPRRRQGEATTWKAGRKPVLNPAQLTDLTRRATDLAERSLQQRGRDRGFGDALEHAGLAFRPGEYLVLAASATVVAFSVAYLVADTLLIALMAAVLTSFGFWLALRVLADRRRSKFASQLSDSLQLLSGSLRAGYGLVQAIDAVAREAQSPTSDEYGRIVIENRLGRGLSESLHSVARRMRNEDFEWVVQAVDIHREVGGDLTEVLDTVSDTIRERDRIRRQIKALSAEGRLSAGILFCLPFAMFLVIRTTNPEYLGEMTGSGMGRIMLGVAFVMLMVGGLWLKKIVKLEF